MTDEQLKRGNYLRSQLDEFNTAIESAEVARLGNPNPTGQEHNVIITIQTVHTGKSWLRELHHNQITKLIGSAELKRIADVARLMILQQLIDKRDAFQAEFDSLGKEPVITDAEFEND